MGTSKICIGNDASSPDAASNTCLAANIYDGGFHDLLLLQGQYFFIYRVGDDYLGDHAYNLSQIRLY